MDAPVNIKDIDDSNWQLSNSDYGQVAVGADDILMCIHNILFTRRGEMPLDPFAGSILYQLLDKPLSIVVPGVIAEITDAITNQESRVSVDQIVPNFSAADGSVMFDVFMTVIATNAPLGYKINLTGQKNGLRAFEDEFTSDFS